MATTSGVVLAGLVDMAAVSPRPVSPAATAGAPANWHNGRMLDATRPLRAIAAFRLWAPVLAAALLATAGSAAAQQSSIQVPAAIPVTGDPARLDAGYWIARAAAPDRVLLDAADIAARNARLLREDASMHDPAALPDALSRDEVQRRILALSKRPGATRYDSAGQPLPEEAFAALEDALALDALPDPVPLRFARTVVRADVRTFADALPVFSRPGDLDIDRFQETVLHPNEPLAVLHESRDRQWAFGIAQDYAGWVRADALAFGHRAQVFAGVASARQLVVTALGARSVFTPEAPAVSRVELPLGTRLRLLHDWPAEQPVNGQLPVGHHVVELPLRDADGKLRFVPALLPPDAPVQVGAAQLTTRNLLRQAFALLGQRYGWGGRHDGHDCSSFVQDVYGSFGLLMPRNTGDQARSPVFAGITPPPGMDATQRGAMLDALQPGDLVFIPGHVMLVVGHDAGGPWVIHATPAVRLRRDGRIVTHPVNAVTVTPLVPLLTESGTPYIELITRIVRVHENGVPP